MSVRLEMVGHSKSYVQEENPGLKPRKIILRKSDFFVVVETVD